MQPEAIAQAMCYPPHEKLGFRPARGYARHDLAALLPAVYVGHRTHAGARATGDPAGSGRSHLGGFLSISDP